MRRQPMVGVQILSPMVEDRMILDIVRHHHERWSGGGYPAELERESGSQFDPGLVRHAGAVLLGAAALVS